MRAFIGQCDRVSLGIFALGAAIGAIWLVALDLGVFLAAITVLVGGLTLLVRHRLIELGFLMIGIGLVVQVGYWVFGVPPDPSATLDPVTGAYPPVTAETFAPGMAGLLLMGGVIFTVAIGAWEAWEGRRRERLDERHRRRRARQIADSREG